MRNIVTLFAIVLVGLVLGAASGYIHNADSAPLRWDIECAAGVSSTRG